MSETITAKDLKKGFTFTKKGRGNHRTHFVIVSKHKDGTISYAKDEQFARYDSPVRISVDEFLKDVFGRRAESLTIRMARARAEAAETAARIERTKESQFTAVLMDFLMDAKAGKDIDGLTEKLEELIKAEREESHEAGYDDGYESHREEMSHGRYGF
jgi:energy-converting hydrogenase A subunit M